MDTEQLPEQVQAVLRMLAGALRAREPAILARIEGLRIANPTLTTDELANKLIRSTRARVAATGAASGAAAIAPGLGTLLALGTVTSQAIYALEQETELVLGIAILYGHELGSSDRRLLEALVVVGIAGGAVKLREDVLVVGGQKVAVAAFRRLPEKFLLHAGGGLVGGILARLAGSRAARMAVRVIPVAVGMTIGAAFDWVAVSALGKAAIRYYGPGGPAARWPALPGGEDRSHVELGG